MSRAVVILVIYNDKKVFVMFCMLFWLFLLFPLFLVISLIVIFLMKGRSSHMGTASW